MTAELFSLLFVLFTFVRSFHSRSLFSLSFALFTFVLFLLSFSLFTFVLSFQLARSLQRRELIPGDRVNFPAFVGSVVFMRFVVGQI